MSTYVLERDMGGKHDEAPGWLAMVRAPGRTSPRSARRRLEFVVDESETLTPIPLTPFEGEVEAW